MITRRLLILKHFIYVVLKCSEKSCALLEYTNNLFQVCYAAKYSRCGQVTHSFYETRKHHFHVSVAEHIVFVFSAVEASSG